MKEWANLARMLRLLGLTVVIAALCGCGIRRHRSAAPVATADATCEDEASCERAVRAAVARYNECTDYERCRPLSDESNRLQARYEEFTQERLAREQKTEDERSNREEAALKRQQEQKAEEQAFDISVEHAERQNERAQLDELKSWRVDRVRQLTERALDPAVATPVISAMLCSSLARTAALDIEMQRERQIERASGVTDLDARRSIGEDLEDERVYRERLSALLRSRVHAQPARCADTVKLQECRTNFAKLPPGSKTLAEYQERVANVTCGEPLQSQVETWEIGILQKLAGVESRD